MSFSFHLRAATVAAALAAASSEMDKVVSSQPVHAADRDTVLATVKAQVGHIESAAAGKHVILSVNGSLGWQGTAAGTANPASDDFALTATSVGVSAYLVAEGATGSHLPALVG